MAVLVSNDNETGGIGSYAAVDGTPTVGAAPGPQAYSGSLALAVPIAPDATLNAAYEVWTNANNAYVRVALRVSVATNPTGTISLQMLSLHDNGFSNDNGAIWLNINSSGTMALSLRNAFVAPGTPVGTEPAILEDTWYIVELKYLAAGASGTLEMRLDGTVIATTTADVGAAVGRIRMGGNAGSIAASVGTIYFDVLEVRDDAYPGIPATYTWDQGGYWWRNDNGSETTATFIGAQDSPL